MPTIRSAHFCDFTQFKQITRVVLLHPEFNGHPESPLSKQRVSAAELQQETKG